MKPSATSAVEAARGDATVLIPPQGGTARVPVLATANVLLSFPEPLASRAVASTKDWEIREFGDGVVARAITPQAQPTTLALSTKTGSIKVNITLVVATAQDAALTLVRFKASSADEAFRAAVQAEAERQTAALRAELADIKKVLNTKVSDRAVEMVARRVITRSDIVKLDAHDRNDDHVIVHVRRAVYLGDDAYLVFEIENRSGAPYRVAKVRVTAQGRDHAGTATVQSNTLDVDPGLIGVIQPGTRAKAGVVLRAADSLVGKSLTLTIEEPEGRGRITLSHDIVLR